MHFDHGIPLKEGFIGGVRPLGIGGREVPGYYEGGNRKKQNEGRE
jgi:hypothetical protein